MEVIGCGKNCKLKKKTLIAQITVGDIILTLADIASDLNNAITLLLDGEMTFGLVSLLLIWSPGLLMVVWMAFRVSYAKTITWKEFLWISILCGPLFPFWVIGSYFRAIWYRNNPDMFETQYAFSVFFKALEGFAEAAPQLLLNVYILLQRWTFCWDQVISMCFSVISLTKTASENHFIELRANKPGLRKILPVSPFFMFHIIYRISIFGTLAVYLKDFVVPVMIFVVSTNILGSRKLLQTHSICTFWTAVSSPFSCSAFKHIENGIVEGPGIMELPETMDFYLWNTVSTVSIFTITLVGVTLLLKSGIISLENFGVSISPIFSCGITTASNTTSSSNQTFEMSTSMFSQTNITIASSEYVENTTNIVSFLRECGEGEDPHDMLLYWVVPVLVGGGILSVALVFAAWIIARKDARWVHAKIKTRCTGEEVSISVRVSDRPSWLAAGPSWRQAWRPDEGEKGRKRTGWKQAMTKLVASPDFKQAAQTTINNDAQGNNEEPSNGIDSNTYQLETVEVTKFDALP